MAANAEWPSACHGTLDVSTSAIVGSTSTLRTRLWSTLPSVCPGALTKNGTVATSPMFCSVTWRRLFTFTSNE